MTDNSLETEYTVEPQRISSRVSIAPTMAGGIAFLVDGEHTDHFYEDELRDLRDAAEAALESMEGFSDFKKKESGEE